MSIATVLAAVSKSASWLFEVTLAGNSVVDYYWSTRTKTWNGHDYTFRIISFSPLNIQLPSPELNLIPGVKTTINCSMKDSSIDGYYAAAFEGAKVVVRLICADSVEELEIRAWSFIVNVATSTDQTLSLQCQDAFSYYLEGDYPNTKLITSELPAQGMENDNVCVPVIYGTPCFPLRRGYPKITATYVDADTFTVADDQTELFSAGQWIYAYCGVDGAKSVYVLSSSFGAGITTVNLTVASNDITANLTYVSMDAYIMGATGVTYTVTEARAPKEAGFKNTFLSSDYTFKQATITGASGATYRTVQLVADDSNICWGDGGRANDVPFKLSHTGTATVTNPADIYSSLLQAFGVPAGMINTTEITAAAAVYTARGIALNLALWYTMPKKQLICKLLAMIGAVPTIGETIGIKILTKISQATINESDVEPKSFQISKSYQRILDDSGYVDWQDAGEPLDQSNRAIVGIKATTAHPANTSIEAEWIAGSDLAQMQAKLTLQKSILRDKTISFKHFANILTIVPGDMISFDAANQGAPGNPNLLTDGNLDIWTSPTNLTHWAETIDVLDTLERSTDAYIGDYSVKMYVGESYDLVPPRGVGINQDYAFEIGIEYEIVVVAKVDTPAQYKGFYLRTHNDDDSGSLSPSNSNTTCTGEYQTYSFIFTATSADDTVFIRRYFRQGGPVGYNLYIGQVIVRKTATIAYDAMITKMTIHEGLWVDVECAGFRDTLDDWGDISASAIVPATTDTSKSYSPIYQGPTDTINQAGGRSNEITKIVFFGTNGELKTSDVPATTGGFIATKTHIRCYNAAGGLRFEADYSGGATDGDVTIGNYVGGQGAEWDQSDGIFDVAGKISATSGTIAGWTIDADEIKKIVDNAGIIIDSQQPAINIRDLNGYDRVYIGKYGTEYGILVKNELNQNIVRLTDSIKVISGWTAGTTALAVSTNIMLDASNKKLAINDPIFGNAGIQLEYNAGSPQMYIGDGTSEYLKYTTAGGIKVSTNQVGGIEILGGGDITLTGSDTDPGVISLNGTSYSTKIGTNVSGAEFAIIPNNVNVDCYIGSGQYWGTDPFHNIYLTSVTDAVMMTGTFSFGGKGARIFCSSQTGLGGIPFVQIRLKGDDETDEYYIFDNNAMYPSTHKLLDLGGSGLAWDYVYADDFQNVADFLFLDHRKENNELIPVDDLAVIRAIKPSGKFDPLSGLELIDDDTLPEWLLSKCKKTGSVMRDPEGNPYLSLRVMISLLMGAVRQLDRKKKDNE